MDVEFEQVEEGIGDEVEGAVELVLVAVVEFEWLACLVADGEGHPFEVMVGEFNVFACFPV